MIVGYRTGCRVTAFPFRRRAWLQIWRMHDVGPETLIAELPFGARECSSRTHRQAYADADLIIAAMKVTK